MDELTGIRGLGNEHAASRIRGISSFPFRGLRRFLCIAAFSIMSTLAFQSVATAQETTGFTGECAGAAEQLQAERPNVQDGVIESYLNYLSDVDGCVSFEGNTYIGVLSVPVYDPDTGEELGILKDLDPDLTSGDFSVTHEEFCGGFVPAYEYVAQDYYDQQANAQEQAILDPDGDGLACTDEDDAFLSGNGGESPGSENPQCIDGILDRDGDGQISPVEAAQAGADATQGIDPCAGTDDGGGTDDGSGGVGDCAGADEQLGAPGGSFGGIFVPDAGGCIYLTGTLVELTLDQLNAPVYDPDTGEEIGIMKDLDPDLSGGDFGVNFGEFCGAFPTPEAEGFSYAGLTAQEYYDQEANSQEQAILDPNSDGLACTPDDEAFLSGDTDYEPMFDLEDTWTGIVAQTDPDGEVVEFDIEAEMIPLSDITDGMVGEVIGEVGYPSVGCSGVWILDGFEGDSLIVEERITDGRENCFETPVTLIPRDDGTLEYYFLDENGIEGECILTLRGSGVPEDDPEDVATDGRKPSEIMDELGIYELPDTGGVLLFALPVGGLFVASGVLGIAAMSKRRAR